MTIGKAAILITLAMTMTSTARAQAPGRYADVTPEHMMEM
jgi:hypothetical protein